MMLRKEDPKQNLINLRLNETMVDHRDWIVRTSGDVCFVLTCVKPGTETSNEKQWCLRHKP